MTDVGTPRRRRGPRRWRVLESDLAAERWLDRAPLRAIGWAEDAIHVLVAVLLVAIGLVVLTETVWQFAAGRETFGERVTVAVNGVLFVIIVMEILRTVIAHFEEGGFQLKPFLIIGIISAVRHILTLGAQVSLGGKKSPDEFRHTQIELGVNAAVVLALVIGLILVRRTETAAEERESAD